MTLRLASLLALTLIAPSGCARDASAPSRGEDGARGAVPPSRGGGELVGTALPPWPDLEWIGSADDAQAPPRAPMLIRFWTDTCPFCVASAPALRALHRDFGPRGLVVVGVHHPKPRGSATSRATVEAAARRLGFEFPIVLDARWEALDAMWLRGRRRAATSAILLVDRRGLVRFVHPGPELHPGGPPAHDRCRRDYEELRVAIEVVLGEPATPTRAASAPRPAG